MLREFKTFIMRGNVLDLAIGKSSEPPSGGSRLNEEVDHRIEESSTRWPAAV